MKPDPQDPATHKEVVALHDIHFERGRQKSEESWSAEHDDQHTDGSLWRAANFYVNIALKATIWGYMNFKQWPWGPEFFKPWKKDSNGNYLTEIDQDRCLIKAGALILAEQERLDRALLKVVAKTVELRKEKQSRVP